MSKTKEEGALLYSLKTQRKRTEAQAFILDTIESAAPNKSLESDA